MIHYNKYLSTTMRRLALPYLCRIRLDHSGSNNLVNLGWGIPNPDYFPFKEATFTKKSGEVLRLPKRLTDEAFQYAGSDGILELLAQLKDMVTKLHAPPHMAERGLFVTSGANATNYVVLHTFVDAGDYVFLPEHTYPTFLSQIKTTEAKTVTIPSDSHGMRPDLLRVALKNSPAGRRKLLYLVPNGDNPTGITLTEERRREIYAQACEYDLLIVEDDPYYCMQYGSKIPPSFLNLDTEGRVIRIDSFAKTVGAGMRLGYVTADKPFTKALEILHTTIMGCAPSLSQIVLNELMLSVGYEGFMQKTKFMAEAYKQKRDVALAAAAKHLSGLCEWREPDGIFLWLKVLGVEDVTEMVQKECLNRNLLLIPGSSCTLDETQPCPYIRVSFSIITPETADEGFQILAEVIEEELKKT